jgi:hypothetical protein
MYLSPVTTIVLVPLAWVLTGGTSCAPERVVVAARPASATVAFVSDMPSDMREHPNAVRMAATPRRAVNGPESPVRGCIPASLR